MRRPCRARHDTRPIGRENLGVCGRASYYWQHKTSSRGLHSLWVSGKQAVDPSWRSVPTYFDEWLPLARGPFVVLGHCLAGYELRGSDSLSVRVGNWGAGAYSGMPTASAIMATRQSLRLPYPPSSAARSHASRTGRGRTAAVVTLSPLLGRPRRWSPGLVAMAATLAIDDWARTHDTRGLS